MIKSIELQFGRASSLSPETISSSTVTLFVGPNNSGKSRILAELHRFCGSGTTHKSDLLLRSVEFCAFSADEANKIVEKCPVVQKHGDRNDDLLNVAKPPNQHEVGRQKFLGILQQFGNSAEAFCTYYLGPRTILLGGHNRVSLTQTQDLGDLQHPPQTSFQVLFRNDERRKKLQAVIYDAFGKCVVLDPTQSGKLSMRFSTEVPLDASRERSLDESAIWYFSQAKSIAELSDGVKAFTGLLTEIIAGDPCVLLIDEPEAFLHPPLAFKLGKEIAKASAESHKRVFASTHSPEIVMGCIQSGVSINIVRLTYWDGVSTARVVSNDKLLPLMRNPLLRSANVIKGLFYDFVVVTEADSDRAFYQEVNERLLLFSPDLGIPNCLFINGHNKQSIPLIVQALRELGIPTAAIFDIDMIKEGGQEFTRILDCGFYPEATCAALRTSRKMVLDKFTSVLRGDQEMSRDGGLKLLASQDAEAAHNFFDQLELYGIFVVREGECESWLKQLNVGSHGPKWLTQVFEKMKENPEADDYVKPSEGDVWGFISKIKKWLVNPARKGIPF